MSAALFHHPGIMKFSYGADHPFQIERIDDLLRVCHALELLPRGESPAVFPPASREEVERFHSPSYLDALAMAMELPPRELLPWGLGTSDNPVFWGLWDACLLTVGGSLAAARWVIEGLRSGEARRAFHPAGGLHHAHRQRASGFCYVNDVVLAIQELLAADLRVLYVDVDAHHGDGVQEAFYATDRVLTVSIHQDGRTLFPGTGFVHETGSGEGTGFSVNVPLWPGSGDPIYDLLIEEILEPARAGFRPDAIVTEIGVDSLAGDPLAQLEWSLRGLDRFLGWVVGTATPWIAVGGGGYKRWNVVRGWCLTWARMLGETIPANRPSEDGRGSLPGSWPISFWTEEEAAPGVEPEACMRQYREVRSILDGLVLERMRG
jgi:acetoin utilization protein AcuC